MKRPEESEALRERQKTFLTRLAETPEKPAAPCCAYLAGLDALHRTECCTSLLFERLGRKMRTLDALRAEAGDDWNQTFYLLYFRTLGDRANQKAYLELARRLPYRFLLRERLTPRAIEAMLLGTSGLLQRYRGDPTPSIWPANTTTCAPNTSCGRWPPRRGASATCAPPTTPCCG